MSDIKLYSEEVRDVLASPPRNIVRWGNSVMLVFILLLLMLAWIIKYPDIIGTQAIITTQIPPQKSLAQVSGTIDRILIKNHDQVAAGTDLAVIENTANYQDVLHLKSVMATVKIDSHSFLFPLDELPMLFLGEIESAFSEFENNYWQYVLNKELQPLANDLTTREFSLEQLRLRLQNLLEQQALYREELALRRKALVRLEGSAQKGAVSTQEFENIRLGYLQAERNFKATKIDISQTKETISNTLNAKKQITINKRREDVNLFKAVIQSFDQLKREVKDWEFKYVLRSNIDGKVSLMKVWNKNQAVEKGDLVFTIIPTENSNYIAKLLAPISNSGKLKIGQVVNIKLSSYPDKEYGVLKGKVEKISLTPNSDQLYLLDASLPEKLITSYGTELEFSQEMQGVGEIITDDLRLIERVFHQFKDIFDQ